MFHHAGYRNVSDFALVGIPRTENAGYHMASGIANSLPEALQQATTNLSQWLAADYKLTPNEIALAPRFTTTRAGKGEDEPTRYWLSTLPEKTSLKARTKIVT